MSSTFLHVDTTSKVAPEPASPNLEPNETLTLDLKSGRTLGYATYGSKLPSSPTIFLFHGMPGSRICGRSFHETNLKVGARLITIDRPGCGNSTFAPRTLVQWPEDVLALADHLEIDTFSIVGASGGAPFALACARYIPAMRLLRTTVVCGIGPVESLGWIPWALMRVAPWAINMFATRFLLPRLLGPYIDKNAAQLKSLIVSQCTTPEEKAQIATEEGESGLDDAVLQHLEAFKQGSQGAMHDGMLLSCDWGFRVEDIVGERVWLVHGDQDTHAPLSMAQWVDEKLGGGRLKVLEGGTHFTIWKECGEKIFRWNAGV
jgi:pimeloyl-ACP methyl ester carboxylesterase